MGGNSRQQDRRWPELETILTGSRHLLYSKLSNLHAALRGYSAAGVEPAMIRLPRAAEPPAGNASRQRRERVGSAPAMELTKGRANMQVGVAVGVYRFVIYGGGG